MLRQISRQCQFDCETGRDFERSPVLDHRQPGIERYPAKWPGEKRELANREHGADERFRGTGRCLSNRRHGVRLAVRHGAAPPHDPAQGHLGYRPAEGAT